MKGQFDFVKARKIRGFKIRQLFRNIQYAQNTKNNLFPPRIVLFGFIVFSWTILTMAAAEPP